MSTPATGVQEWQDIPWPQVERDVHTLQRRIYRTSQKGDRRLVHRLQRLLMSSWSAKCLAVRQVTQDNQGKRTPGIDGIAALSPEERMDLLSVLSLDAKPQPVRRVWIPKPGTDEKRPLGIPTLHDRAVQALVKLALEPEWEAKFEPNSYGFRPGRSCHDAIEAIFGVLHLQPKYVLDADIAKCFDRINHDALLDKLDTFPAVRRLIKGWLKAGVLDGDTLFPTEEGTPQGGVISPLLANIALHGLEEHIRASFPRHRSVNGKRSVPWQPHVIRYADDFVVLHLDREAIQQCYQLAQQWLKGLGLELKPSKTRLTHTLEDQGGGCGFNFLGFQVRQYPKGKYRSGKMMGGKKLGFKTIIRPSKEKVLLHYRKLAAIIRRMSSGTQAELIQTLNPVIAGWSNYYRTVNSKMVFQKLDDLLFRALRNWARRRHHNKGARWIVRRYWRMPAWTFGCAGGPTLRKHAATPIQRHAKVQGSRSPFDGDWIYWTSRLGRYPGISHWMARLLKRQKGVCYHCGQYFMLGALLEIHHVDGLHSNGLFRNLAAVHRHCHDQIHGKGSCKGSIADNDGPTEEPDEAKVSRPVLKTTAPGDWRGEFT
jgi:RNA-directed DNA polymerase